ncbi:DUF1700 domain-containing protein [Streptococcus pantholopis]|uniref:DUF1700 domain-containing protein n=1 Tax=Streptococcus pantholopis TaxID=1811193 RepID=A0A172Q7T9_9STRE|nr:DUF1700 domain-containing protein [Streptococcus pantholopis]AND79518.1 hypothetical protein A0O21_05475 [Streptococcus pantholopis]
MTRKEYLEQLEKHLKKLPQQDFTEAMDYFSEYFDEAGPENEAQVIEELGSPKEAANEILYRLLDEKMDQNPKSAKSRANLLWIALLALLASPVAFPLFIVAVSLLFTAVIVFFSLLLAAVCVALSFLVVGADFIIEAFMTIPSDFAAALVELGMGGLFLGLPLLLILLILQIGKWCSQLTVTVVGGTVSAIRKRGKQ